MNLKLPTSLVFLLSFIFLPITGLSQGDLMIMPKRLVFDSSQRTQEINLINSGKDTATYAINFVQYRMTETGSFEEITEPEEGQNFASDFIRYYPRRVTLAPNESQTLRVQLTRTGNLKPGEYRSHMYFRAIEDEKALGAEEAQDAEGISINIKTVFGISIPIIIKHGESTTQLSFSNLELVDQNERQVLSMLLNRTGNMSVYGELEVIHISASGKKNEVAKIKGISVYTPNAKRQLFLPLQKLEGVDLTKGKLIVTYSSDKGKKLASSELNLEK